MYQITRRITVELESLVLELGSKSLTYIQRLIKMQKGLLNKDQMDLFKTTLNDLYWKRSDILPMTKDLLRNLHKDLLSLQEVLTPTPKPTRRELLMDIQRRQQLRRQTASKETTMSEMTREAAMELKASLIELGKENKDLRPEISRVIQAMEKEAAGGSLLDAMDAWMTEVISMVSASLKKHPKRVLSLHRYDRGGDGKAEFQLMEDRRSLVLEGNLQVKGGKLHLYVLGPNYGSVKKSYSMSTPKTYLANQIALEVREVM